MASPLLSGFGHEKENRYESVTFSVPSSLGKAIKGHFTKKGELSKYLIWLVEQDMKNTGMVLEGDKLVNPKQVSLDFDGTQQDETPTLEDESFEEKGKKRK